MSTPARETVKQAAGASQGPRSPNFKVKFSVQDRKTYNIDCGHPGTVLEAIKSHEISKEKIKCADENIIIQLGEKDKKFTVATHFPCSCIGKGESVILYSQKKVVEANLIDKMIYPKDKYVFFYIDTVGGENAKTKMVFRNDSVKQFKYLCVYGIEGMTVEEALKRDGRFIDDLGNFHLSNNNNPGNITGRTDLVGHLEKKRFKICLPRKKTNYTAPVKGQRQSPRKNPSSNLQSKRKLVSDVVQQSGISVKTALEKHSDNTEEIYKQLREQCPELKKLMESRFPGKSYQEALNLERESFGKIQQSFSEVHRIRKLLELGKSVCKIDVCKRNVCKGTGFVLFDRFILTNAHLFKDYVDGRKLQEGVEVFALFGYGDPELETNYSCFTAKKRFVDFDLKLDYAILELKPEGKKSNHQTTNVVPQGLLKTFCPLPPKGEACIIGHPKGEVKKIDPICIIEKEKRGQAVEDHLHSYKDTLFTLSSIRQIISDQGIGDIMMGGSKDSVGTYNTFMYHGASGSPVFDALGRVFGLHTAGYTYGFPKEESVIEYAQPVLAIFKKFVDNLRKRGKNKLFEKVRKAAKENPDLKRYFLKRSREDSEGK